MKKYLISTLTAAAAMAVPAFADATLLGSWDFSKVTSGATGTITSTSGSLTLTTGSSVTDDCLVITSGDNNHETTIDISSASVTAAEGISVVITLEGWSFIDKNNILASLSTSGTTDYVAAGLKTADPGGAFSGNGSGAIWGAASGSDSHFGTTGESLTFAEGTATTIILTFIGDTVSYYQDGVLIGTGTISSGYYDSTATIKDVAIGSWDRDSTNSEPSSLTISSLEIWKGDVTTLPEPELFSIFLGISALGLMATRRRRRRKVA